MSAMIDKGLLLFGELQVGTDHGIVHWKLAPAPPTIAHQIRTTTARSLATEPPDQLAFT
jgi:hypothetical protein